MIPCRSIYNLILGRLTLEALGAVSSTVKLKTKYLDSVNEYVSIRDKKNQEKSSSIDRYKKLRTNIRRRSTRDDHPSRHEKTHTNNIKAHGCVRWGNKLHLRVVVLITTAS